MTNNAINTLNLSNFSATSLVGNSTGSPAHVGAIPFNTFLQSSLNLTDISNPATALINLNGLSLAGGTMTGFLTLNADPVNPFDAVTKSYADALISGFNIHTPVAAASTANYTGVYNNGASGVGATITIALDEFDIDSLTGVVGQRYLLKDQTFRLENGIYVLT